MKKKRMSEVIKDYLEKNGIKQCFLVERTGIPSNTLSDILNNKRKLLADEFVKIISALDVDANYFIDRINNQNDLYKEE